MTKLICDECSGDVFICRAYDNLRHYYVCDNCGREIITEQQDPDVKHPRVVMLRAGEREVKE